MNEVLTVALIIAVTAFFKEQFGFSGKAALACAFGVALLVGIAPLLGTQFPTLAPWIEQVLKVIVLFLSASGSVDAIKQLRSTRVIR
jgi:hypothetical protein